MGEILLVDDDTTLREALAELFRRRGLEVLEAADGRAALALLRETHPSLVLADLTMPRGRALVREMRRDPRLATIPVFVVSSCAARELGRPWLDGLWAGVRDLVGGAEPAPA